MCIRDRSGIGGKVSLFILERSIMGTLGKKFLMYLSPSFVAPRYGCIKTVNSTQMTHPPLIFN